LLGLYWRQGLPAPQGLVAMSLEKNNFHFIFPLDTLISLDDGMAFSQWPRMYETQ